MESRGHMTISAFRRFGDGVYSFSRIMLFNGHGQWRAVTVKSTNRVVLASERVETTPLVGHARDEIFTDPDILLKCLIQQYGFVLMMDDVKDSLVD